MLTLDETDALDDSFLPRGLVGLLPLQYLAYFPSAVFLGKITGLELAKGLLVESSR